MNLRHVLLTSLISVILMSSCIGPSTAERGKTAQDEETVKADPPVVFEIDPLHYAIAPEKIPLTIRNRSAGEIQYGAEYTVERFDQAQEQWNSVEFPDKVVFNSILYVLPPAETHLLEVFLYPDKVDYQPGIYRIKKQVYVDEQNQFFYAEFVLDGPL